MKKLLTLIAVVSFAAIVLPSCKKDYTCKCTDSNGDPYDFKINNSRRPEAQLICEGYSIGYSCHLD